MAEPVALPSSFSRRALLGLVLIAFALVGVAVELSTQGDVVYFEMHGLVGVVLVVRALVLRRRPALLLDDEGIKEWDGSLLVPWSNAALIWVGDERLLGSRRLLRYASVTMWSTPSLDYARRTGFVADKLFARTVATRLPAEELAAQIRRFTSADVRTGMGKDLRRLMTELRSPGSSDSLSSRTGAIS